MELSWTTFVLEFVNFLVLVWVLKRLFYAPVKRVITQRRAAVEKILNDAKAERREAEELKSKYDGRLREWAQEKELQKEVLRKELNEERTKQLKLVEIAVATEREKAEAQEQKKAAERLANDEKEAMKLALEFTSRLFGELSSPALEGKIVELLVHRISSTRNGEFPTNGTQLGNHPVVMQVRSAYSLTAPQRDALTAALKQKLGSGITVMFETDPKLIAGLEIAMGSFVVRANLRDELEYFSMSANHE